MQALRAAFTAINEPWPRVGASRCAGDARLYHKRGHAVALFGAGRMEHAAGADEHIDVPDLQKALAISTLATWMLCAE
jgi:acetylornithine deacetylase/succinyl-diaminopimelate desuccinylase-like protein